MTRRSRSIFGITRDSSLLKGHIKLTSKDCEAVVFVNPTRLSAAGFATLRTERATFYYTYRDAAQRDRHIQQFFASCASSEKAKVQRKAERKAEFDALDARKHFQKGDVVYNSWGYDQTNVDYYVVHQVTAKFVTLAPCSAETAESGRTVPVTEKVNTAKLKRHGIYAYNGGACVKFKHGAGSKWDGRPKYATPANAGH